MRLIDADALLKYIPSEDMVSRLAVLNAPTVEPMRKKGKWIRDEFGSVCSSCGLYAYRDKYDEPWESVYCPICGADMRGEGND